MGKKKSVVLMTLLTIVMIVLCAITAFPTIPLGVKDWNPAVMQFDLGLDLGGEHLGGHVGGGYYAYYYPDGVMPAAEYDGEEGYKAHGGLYLSTDEKYGIYQDDGETQIDEFKTNVKEAVAIIAARYEAKGYEACNVSLVDDYAIYVEVPASQVSDNVDGGSAASSVISMYANTGALTFQKGGSILSQMDDEDITVKDIVKSVKVKTSHNEYSYIEMKFTSLGKEMLQGYESSGSSDSSSSTTLDIVMGEETIYSFDTSNDANLVFNADDGLVQFYHHYKEDKHNVETLAVLLNSALKDGSADVTFTASEIRSISPVNTIAFVYGVLLILLLVLIVTAIVRMGRFGVINLYATLSYVIITALCYAFISGGVFVVTMGTVLVFVMGLVLINALSYRVYNAIVAETKLGKTVESSVKSGYKKNLLFTVDVYAVLTLGAIALLIGAGGLATVAWQAIIALLAGAFISLLWARVLNYVFLSASKDKYKYFKLVREDDDDE